jgi:outer membrane murein-binding lipoprotein Lpp
LWEVLQGAGYATPPQYTVQLFEEHRVPCCRVSMTLEPHPLQPGWCSLDSESFGFKAEDTVEFMALHVLTTFCGFHPLELSTHPISLFPAEKEDDPMWKDRVEHAKDVWALYPGHTAHLTVRCMSAMYRVQALRGEAMSQLMGLVESTKITLDNRDDLVVDLSTELEEKDLQVEQMANQIQELKDQVEARENTIKVLEDQLQTTQQQLEEANQHLDLHHQEIEDMQAEGADEDVDIEGGEEPEPASSLDTAGSGRPPSPESSVASFAHLISESG